MPWTARAAIRRLFDDLAPDIVHAQAHFVVGRYSIREASRRQLPVVVTNHFVPDNVRTYVRLPRQVLDLIAEWSWRDMQKVFEPAALTTMQTDLSARLLTEKGYQHPIRTVSCGIDLTNYASNLHDEANCDQTSPTVLFVGRLAREKHIDDIIRALAMMSSGTDLRAIIVGTGDQLQYLNELAAELRVLDRVEFRQHVPEDELRRLYSEVTFFCMPSTAELQCLACLEAMAASRPVVVANALALPHLVEEGRNGYLFDPGDVETLSRLFEMLAGASNRELNRLGAESLKMVEKHDITRTIDIFESEYKSLTAASNGNRPH